LISRMMTVSIIAAGQIKLSPQPMDLSALVEAVVADMAEAAQQANCELSFRSPGAVWGQWSSERIEEVIRNLLQNALKFARGKPVEVEVGGDAVRAWVSVKDHGIGIAEADQERIFGRFQRAVDSRNYGGFGLGLWISKEIVNACGGEISVSSQPGEGATFTILLPRGVTEGAEETRNPGS